MLLESDLTEFILEDTDISAMIDDRIYPIVLPQSPDVPALTYFRVSGARFTTMEGPNELMNPKFQINSWAETYSEAKTLANLVMERLHGYRGAFNAEEVLGIFLNNEEDLIEDLDDGTRFYRVRMDFLLWKN